MPGVMQVQRPQGTSLGDVARTGIAAYGAYKDFTKPDAPQQPQQQAPAPPQVDLNAQSKPGAVDRAIKMRQQPGWAGNMTGNSQMSSGGY